MNYEEAEVKKYTTKNKKTGAERTSFQIHIKKDSKFREAKTIGLIDLSEIEKIKSLLEANNIEEKEAEINELKEAKLQLEQELQQLKSTNGKLTSENETLKEEKLQLQEDLLTEKEKYEKLFNAANKNVVEAKDKILNIQKEHKEELADKDSEISELNYKLNNEKDLVKTLLVVRSDFLKQGALKRLFKVEPDSSKKVSELKELPEDVEATISKE